MLAFLILISIGASPLHSDSTDVAAAVHRFHEALEKADSATAIQLLHPDVVIIEAGDVERLAQYRGHHLPADIEFAQAVKAEKSELHVTVSGKFAWVWSTSSSKGTFRGRAVDSVGAEMMTLVKTDKGWRITGIHWSSHRRSAQ